MSFSQTITLMLMVLIILPCQAFTISGVISLTDKQGNTIDERHNIVIFIEGEFSAAESSTQIQKLSHKGKAFSPRVMTLSKGDSIDFLNDDNIFHNVFSVSRIQPFDLGIYPSGTSKLKSFDQPGMVRLYCNIHPNMISHVLVLNNKFHTKTDEKGYFSIEDIPAGNYKLRIWHEFSEEYKQPLNLTRNQNNLKIHIQETKAFIQHKNKFGKTYRAKY